MVTMVAIPEPTAAIQMATGARAGEVATGAEPRGQTPAAVGHRGRLAIAVPEAVLVVGWSVRTPVAILDQVARHDFMATVLAAMADGGISVVLSSHVLAELERVADYLILLSRGRVQVADEVDDLFAGHRVLTGPAAEANNFGERPVVLHVRRAEAPGSPPSRGRGG
jgi:hypothetical protein